MPPRRIAAARIARKGYALPAARTGAGSVPAKGAKPDPLSVALAVPSLDAAEWQIRRAARYLQEAHPGYYGTGTAGYYRALRSASLAVLDMAQAAARTADP